VSDEPNAPIELEYRLDCTPEQAFAVYTDRIGDWWDGRYSANGETLEDVRIEPGVGGRIYAVHSDFGRHDWGEVTVWEPGRRLVHSFTLAQDAQHPSEVRLDFEPAPGGATVLRFAHGGWTPENVAVRHKFGDWAVLLDAYAVLADSASERGGERSA
jgi:hypothetical protein